MSMFGALNRFIGRLDAAPEEQRGGSQHGAYGFQVLRNTNRELAIEPWFDFVIGINGRTIDNPDPHLFGTEIRNSAGHSISLGLFSAKGQRIREVYVPVPADPPSLGLSLQWVPLTCTEDVWHILDVIPNSPADAAGLLPYGDYVIGSPEGLVRGESGLGELVEDYMNRPLRLFVYNHEYNVVRPITITPSRSWGGEGALGCVLGFGALHRIPAPLDEPPQGPGETLFDTSGNLDEGVAALSMGAGLPRPTSAASIAAAQNNAFEPVSTTQSTEFLVPANMTSPPPGGINGPPPGGHGKPRKQRAHHQVHAGPGAGIDDYLAEGEAKSKEEDRAPGSKSPVPPPPKVGPPMGPPKRGTPTPVQTEGEGGG